MAVVRDADNTAFMPRVCLMVFLAREISYRRTGRNARNLLTCFLNCRCGKPWLDGEHCMRSLSVLAVFMRAAGYQYKMGQKVSSW